MPLALHVRVSGIASYDVSRMLQLAYVVFKNSIGKFATFLRHAGTLPFLLAQQASDTYACLMKTPLTLSGQPYSAVDLLVPGKYGAAWQFTSVWTFRSTIHTPALTLAAVSCHGYLSFLA